MQVQREVSHNAIISHIIVNDQNWVRLNLSICSEREDMI